MWQQHPDPDVQDAIVKLCDALCSYERITGRDNVLIVREVGGFAFRANSGKPIHSEDDDISDAMLILALEDREPA